MSNSIPTCQEIIATIKNGTLLESYITKLVRLASDENSTSEQIESTLGLPSYSTLGEVVYYPISMAISVFTAVKNMTDAEWAEIDTAINALNTKKPSYPFTKRVEGHLLPRSAYVLPMLLTADIHTLESQYLLEFALWARLFFAKVHEQLRWDILKFAQLVNDFYFTEAEHIRTPAQNELVWCPSTQ
jgi:hypothetical protein